MERIRCLRLDADIIEKAARVDKMFFSTDLENVRLKKYPDVCGRSL